MKMLKLPQSDEEYKKAAAMLAERMAREFPGFAIIKKGDSPLMRFLNAVGRGFNPEFMTKYITVISPKIYVPDDYFETTAPWKHYIMLVHERVHLLQVRRCGGLLPFLFLYALVPLPAKLAYFRRSFEQEAYRADIVVHRTRRGTRFVRSRFFQQFILKQFHGSMYFWAWHSARDITRWLTQVLDDIDAGVLTWEQLSQLKLTTDI
jgi:hypothetical protein